MSLVCHECEVDVQPSDSLPGREGTFVHPNLPALVWLPEKPKETKLPVAFIEAPQDLCLCFSCIDNHLLEIRRPSLQIIYDSYLAEIDYGRKDFRERSYDQLDQKLKRVSKNCLYCDSELPKDLTPYFTARVIDKVYSEKRLSFFSSYQWSDVKEGMTKLNFCLDCFNGNFDRASKQLSLSLRGLPNFDKWSKKSEFYFSPEFTKAIGGEEQLKRYLEEFST